MFLTRPQAELFTLSLGHGPQALLAHGGWVGSGEVWLPTFAAMGPEWRCVTYDHRGTGASVTTGAITFPAMVDDVFAVMDACGIARCTLASESAGAPVVLAAARRDPSRFEALVLVAPRVVPRDDLAAMRAGCLADFDATMDAFVAACLPDGTPAMRRWGGQIVRRAGADAAVALLDAMVWPDALAVSVPVLVLQGGRDTVVTPAMAEAVVAAIPGARLSLRPEAGHVPTVTMPDWVAAEISAFRASLPFIQQNG